MTLLISCLLIAHMNGAWWLYLIAGVVWLFHISFHGD